MAECGLFIPANENSSIAVFKNVFADIGEEQIVSVAEDVKEAGAAFLRGGAFKPRTSPYAFQGLRAGGIELLRHAREKTGLPVVTEIMSPAHLVLFEDVDIIQVGARLFTRLLLMDDNRSDGQ